MFYHPVALLIISDCLNSNFVLPQALPHIENSIYVYSVFILFTIFSWNLSYNFWYPLTWIANMFLTTLINSSDPCFFETTEDRIDVDNFYPAIYHCRKINVCLNQIWTVLICLRDMNQVHSSNLQYSIKPRRLQYKLWKTSTFYAKENCLETFSFDLILNRTYLKGSLCLFWWSLQTSSYSLFLG